MDQFRRLTAMLLATSVILSLYPGCASTTAIRTTNPKAKIYVDGEYRGVGAVTYSDQKVLGSTTNVKMEAPGCLPETVSFSRNEEFSIGPCIAGFFLLVPFLWVMSYKPEHVFEYTCRQPNGMPVPQLAEEAPVPVPLPAPALPPVAPEDCETELSRKADYMYAGGMEQMRMVDQCKEKRKKAREKN